MDEEVKERLDTEVAGGLLFYSIKILRGKTIRNGPSMDNTNTRLT